MKRMKLRIAKTVLPELFYPLDKGIVTEARLKLTRHSRLYAKLLVFDSNKSLCRFFTKVLDRPESVCPKTLGICSALSSEVWSFKKEKERHWLEVDKNYFCLIGLIQGHLNMEIICHEAVHAAFAYKARMNRRVWSDGDQMDEEEICYPAGCIARLINQHLHSEGLYKT